MNKKALSALIATVLLILLSIAAIVILSSAIIPFVKEKMSEAQECSEIIKTADALAIDAENGFACYYDENGLKAKITIHRGNIEIKGVRIAVRGGGDSKIVDITEGTLTDVKLLTPTGETTNLVLPGKGGEKTYIISNVNAAESAIIAPIMPSGQMCKETDEIDLEKC